MSKGRRIPLPKGKYVSEIEVNVDDIHVHFKKKQKVALLFIALNERYWPYIVQVIKDCKEKFLPHHNVDYFVWTDVDTFGETHDKILKQLDELKEKTSELPIEMALKEITDMVIPLIARFHVFKGVEEIIANLAKQNIVFRRDAEKMWIETPLQPGTWMSSVLLDEAKNILKVVEEELAWLKGQATLIETVPMEWPIPTLMRYHLFLNKEDELKDHDSIFYLDADMRVVEKISDEILSEGLTVAPHPGYAISSRYIAPYEPNTESKAYVPRLGRVTTDEYGKKRFIPFYAAGGFQGGDTKTFLKAMKVMKKSIDADFNKNYMAIWNDESHWNKFLWEYQNKGGLINFLDVSYIYPDSLIKEYYEPLWGKTYIPKIVTITKPFSLSPQGGEVVNKMIEQTPKV